MADLTCFVDPRIMNKITISGEPIMWVHCAKETVNSVFHKVLEADIRRGEGQVPILTEFFAILLIVRFVESINWQENFCLRT